MSRHLEDWAQMQYLNTQNANTSQVTVLGRPTDPVLEIGSILRHLNCHNFLIPNPRELRLADPSF